MKGEEMKRYLTAILALTASAALAGAVWAQSVDEILSRVDTNMSFQTIRYVGRMEITVGGETRSKTMIAVAQGSSKAFAEFTNPEDKGVRYLKLEKNLWIYFPKEQDTVKISGHLLKEGMMGSDVSYEDALESSDFRVKYSATLTREEPVGERRCYVLELKAKVPTAAYDRWVIWIDAERYVALKEEMYARSGKMLKSSQALQVTQISGRWFPARTQYVSKIRSNTSTVFAMTNVELDPKLDPQQFTMAALTR
jgi:outer membrane lipoprotein-sorting protein